MNFPFVIQKLRRNVEDFGVRKTFRKTISYLVKPVFLRRLYRIYRYDISTTSLNRDPQANEFDYKWLTPEDQNEIKQIEEYAEWLRGKLTGHLEDNWICLSAMKEQTVSGFNIARFNQVHIPLIQLNRSFRPGFAWSEQIAVHRSYRRKGLASTLRCKMIEALREKGCTRFYGGTLAENKATLQLAKSLGFKEVADITFVKQGKRKRWTFSRPGS